MLSRTLQGEEHQGTDAAGSVWAADAAAVLVEEVVPRGAAGFVPSVSVRGLDVLLAAVSGQPGHVFVGC